MGMPLLTLSSKYYKDSTKYKKKVAMIQIVVIYTAATTSNTKSSKESSEKSYLLYAYLGRKFQLSVEAK